MILFEPKRFHSDTDWVASTKMYKDLPATWVLTSEVVNVCVIKIVFIIAAYFYSLWNLITFQGARKPEAENNFS